MLAEIVARRAALLIGVRARRRIEPRDFLKVRHASQRDLARLGFRRLLDIRLINETDEPGAGRCDLQQRIHREHAPENLDTALLCVQFPHELRRVRKMTDFDRDGLHCQV
ncbi:hypothetical protein ACSQ76_12240 [Roseovarius sp. B08]|uniref:hypothetical protein n=1 Tax=Roseovarius sp. B08 TaxID=3449223 RepID=UPI003EDBC554